MRVVIGLLIHLGAPSALFLTLLAPKSRRWVMLPTAAAAAIGWNLLVAQLLGVLSTRADHRTALIADFALACIAAVAWLRQRRVGGPPDTEAATKPDRVALCLVAGAGLLAALTFGLLFNSAGSTPPYQDAVHHGFMIRQIDAHGTVDPEIVASLDAAGDVVSAHYYPLGLHATSAFAHQITGARIDHLLAAWAIIAAAVLLPIGLFAYANDLLGSAIGGGIAALAGVLFAEFPYLPYAWGGLPTIVGTALAPGIAFAIADVGRRWNSREAALAALGLFGLFSIANNAVFLPLALALCVLLAQPSSLGPRETLRRIARVAAVGAACLVLLIPTLPGLRSGLDERSGLARLATGHLSKLLVDILLGRLELGIAQYATSLLALGGLVVLVARRRFGLATVFVAIVVLASIAWVPGKGALTRLTLPWYGSAYRIAYNLAIVKAICIGACGVALVNVWRDSNPRHRSSGRVIVGALAAVAVLTAPTLTARFDDRLVGSIKAGVVLTDGSEQAFQFLAHANPPSSTVAGEYCDESTWMYGLDGVSPLFGVLTPLRTGLPEMRPRIDLLRTLSKGDHDPRQLPIVGQLGIEFVYFGERSICPITERLMTLAGLRSNRWLTEVFNSGGSHVFQLGVPGTI